MWSQTGSQGSPSPCPVSLVNENVIPYCYVKMSSPGGYRLLAFLGRDRRRHRTSPRVRRRGAPLRTRGISGACEGIDRAASLAIVRWSASWGLGPRRGGEGVRREPRRTLLLGPRKLGERLSHLGSLSLAA